MLKNATKYLLQALLLLLIPALAGCEDSPIFDGGGQDVGTGNALVRFSVTFRPLEEAAIGSRSADGIMDGIDDLSVLVYDLDGRLIPDGYFRFLKGVDFTATTGVALDGSPTARAEVDSPVVLPRGRYRIYAVANAGDLSADHPEEISDESLLRTLRIPWISSNVGANNQMSGWFHVDTANGGTSHSNAHDAGYPSSYSNQIANVGTVTINGNKTLHAWLRRTTAKVTVDYDATRLNEKTWIYIRSVRIRNIASSCQLIANNTVEPLTPDKEQPEYDPHDPENPTLEGEVHFYEAGEAAAYAADPNDYSNFEKWPCLAKGNAHFGSHTPGAVYDDKPGIEPFTALYAFENLQGEGKDKHQLPIDGDVDNLDYNWRDAYPSGTFIEVDAYYISQEDDNLGSGPIRYRFMLGKDITTNYDFERNYHFKVTLCFLGRANNIDWHIDYREEEKPGLFAPDPYYVSYKYNSSMEYPIRIEGEIASEYLDVTITSNDWRPFDQRTNDYPPERVGDWQWVGKSYMAFGESTDNGDFHGSAVWNGFLSLYDTSTRSEVYRRKNDGTAVNNKQNYNLRDWYRIPNDVYSEYEGTSYDVESYPDRAFTVTYKDDSDNSTHTIDNVTKDEGYRRFKVPTADGEYVYNTADGKLDTSKSYGTYRVVKKGSVTTFFIPLYTRALILTTTTSYTGNNPFTSYLRKAELNIHAKLKDGDEIIDLNRKKTVFQVRRIINPTLVTRRHDNTNCFTVKLLERQGEEYDTDFEPFRSLGPWSAEIVSGEGWEIVGRSSGHTESYISFTVRPTAKIQPHETRCAKVEVWYHNRSCRHVILLRQGYAPIDMEATREENGPQIPRREDNVLWHTFNLWWNDADGPRLTDCPLDAGSFFRHDINYNDPIDAINNNYSTDPTLYDFGKEGRYDATGTTRTGEKDGYFWLSPVKNKVLKKWDNIGSNCDTDGKKFKTLSLYGAKVHPPVQDDWECFVNNPNIDYAFGVAYGDGAYTVQSDPEKVAIHSYYPKLPYDPTDPYKLDPYNVVGSDPRGEFGTRVCCVYNSNSPRNPILILPIGNTGYGRRTTYRKFNSNGAKGELRYANRFELMKHGTDAIPYQPLLYSIYTNYGAIYWTNETAFTQWGWDINYSTFDFNTFDCARYDGCYIRFVQPKTGSGSKTPTADNPCWDHDQTQKTSRPAF